MKKLLLLTTLFLAFACSKDDEDKYADDIIIGNWELIEYNRYYFEGDEYEYSYPCLRNGRNEWVFKSDGTGVRFRIFCEPLLSIDNPKVNIENETVGNYKQNSLNFVWEKRDDSYFLRGENGDGSLSEWGELPIDSITETTIIFDTGEATSTYVKQ